MDEEWKEIKKSLENPNYKWRTIDGVAKATGLDSVTVVSSLSNYSDIIVKSSIPSKDGKDLYTTRDHYEETSSTFSLFISSLKNRTEE